MAKKTFCDICGRELTPSNAIQFLGRDLCANCCKKLVPSKQPRLSEAQVQG